MSNRHAHHRRRRHQSSVHEDGCGHCYCPPPLLCAASYSSVDVNPQSQDI